MEATKRPSEPVGEQRVCKNHCEHVGMYVRGGVCNGPSKAGLDSICGHVCTFEPVSVPEADEVGDAPNNSSELCRMPVDHVCWSACDPKADEHYHPTNQWFYDTGWREGLAYAINLVSTEIPIGSPQGLLPAAPHVKGVIRILEKALNNPLKEGWKNGLFTPAISPVPDAVPALKTLYAEFAEWWNLQDYGDRESAEAAYIQGRADQLAATRDSAIKSLQRIAWLTNRHLGGGCCDKHARENEKLLVDELGKFEDDSFEALKESKNG